MRRREFLKTGVGAAMASAAIMNCGERVKGSPAIPISPMDEKVYVSPGGNDTSSGSEQSPFQTIRRALQFARNRQNSSVGLTIVVREGTYYLHEPITFTPEDSGKKGSQLVVVAHPGEKVTVSGGQKLDCRWSEYKGGIMQSAVPESVDFTQLFINGRRQIRARYPNYDRSVPGHSGYLEAAGPIGPEAINPCPDPNEDMTFSTQAPRGFRFDPTTFTKRIWANPQDAEVNIFQAAYWGNLQWKIKCIDQKTNTIWFGEGGQQIGAKWSRDPAVLNKHSRFFIENVFEELDSPGEWFLDKHAHILYYYPEPGTDLSTALVEVPRLERVFQFVGSEPSPVEHISIRGFRIAHTTSTYLKDYDVPSLSDWAIHRGGAVYAEGTRNCSVEACLFDAVGGNGVFVNNFNREFTVTDCKLTETGDSAICFVGDLERTNGSQRAFPFQCVAANNLIHDCGVFGKQIAGIYISRAKRITASHNLIYNMPRAAICIGDGTWGGHVIEFNQTHDTVLETSDHGPFNAWGRDRGWSLAQSHGIYSADRSLDVWEARVDAMEPVLVRNNFFDEKSGWGLDLDDGASNYEIYNNISIGGVSMKLREGAYRKVYNNIWYQAKAAPCFHVGNNFNHDEYFNNITTMEPGITAWPAGWPWWPQMFYSVIAPPAVGPWFDRIDNNCFYATTGEFQAVVDQLRSENGKRNARRYTLEEWRKLGFDANSVFADPLFVDPTHHDFRVRPESPALKVGFKNFEMGKWGLTSDFPNHWRD